MKSSFHLVRFLAVTTIVVSALAQGAEKELHVRGEVLSVGEAAVTVKVRNGETVTVRLPDKFDILDASKTTLDSVAENSYIGVAAAPLGPNKVRALGVLIFPEGARGLNEGLFPWDLRKNSTMTNATVARLAKKGSATEIQVRFGDKTQDVVVDPTTSVAQIVPGTRELLVVGAKVIVFANQGDEATPVAHLVMVGKDGFLPPV